jgi:hypothetical protein
MLGSIYMKTYQIMDSNKNDLRKNYEFEHGSPFNRMIGEIRAR